MRYAWLIVLPTLLGLGFILWQPQPVPPWLHQDFDGKHVLHTTDITVRIGLGVVCQDRKYAIGIVTAEPIKTRKKELKARYQFDKEAWHDTIIAVEAADLVHFSELLGPFLPDLLSHRRMQFSVAGAAAYEFDLGGILKYPEVLGEQCGVPNG